MVLRIVAALIGLALLTTAGIVLIRTRGEIADIGMDFCSKSTPPANVIAVAIDASDPLEPVQERLVESSIRDTIGELEPGDRIDIYVVNAPRGGLADLRFSKCNPGKPTAMDGIVSNANERERLYQEEFTHAIDTALATVIAGGASEQSPILESVRAIAANSFTKNRAGAGRHLILVSDMVQNTAVYSMFKSGVGSFPAFAQSPNYADAQADLSGVKVDLLVVLRATYSRYQTREMLLWWEEYFRDGGGALTGYKRI